MSGKGDTNRTVDYRSFRRNFDMIFGQCSKHPTYTPGTLRPRCHSCRRIWLARKLSGTPEKAET